MPTSKQRREAERRRLQRQLQRRAQRENRRRRVLTAVSVLGVLAVVAVVVVAIAMSGDDDKPAAGGGKASSKPAPASSTPAPSTSASTSAAPAYPCTWKKGGSASRAVRVPSTTKPPRTGKVDLSVRTSQGAMTFTLDRSKAPCAVASFVSLAKQHYFDGTACHRLTSGGLSVLQCGDPTGSGSGGPGYSFGDELTGKEKYTRGVLAMANAGPNTNGSQFFVVYKDSQLNPAYTVFGTVSKGLGVVDKVAAKGSNPAGDGKPKLPISLTRVTVTQ